MSLEAKITHIHRLKNDTLDLPERLEPQSFPMEYAGQETTGGCVSPAVEKRFGWFADIAMIARHRLAEANNKLNLLKHQGGVGMAVPSLVSMRAEVNVKNKLIEYAFYVGICTKN